MCFVCGQDERDRAAAAAPGAAAAAPACTPAPNYAASAAPLFQTQLPEFFGQPRMPAGGLRSAPGSPRTRPPSPLTVVDDEEAFSPVTEPEAALPPSAPESMPTAAGPVGLPVAWVPVLMPAGYVGPHMMPTIAEAAAAPAPAPTQSTAAAAPDPSEERTVRFGDNVPYRRSRGGGGGCWGQGEQGRSERKNYFWKKYYDKSREEAFRRSYEKTAQDSL